jgi:hypothetical protein
MEKLSTPRRRLSQAQDMDRKVNRRRGFLVWKWRYSKREIIAMVREPWLRPIVSMHLAARKAQQYIRGGLARRRLRGLLKPREIHAPVVDALWNRSKVKGVSAARIQRAWRNSVHHVRYRRYRLYQIAALEITLWWQAKLDEPEKRAARLMQTAYRRYCDKKVFRYYRDLLSFQNSGDPKEMLRSINPGEVALMDQASGAFVRFRLGGYVYPPTIYYKIFTKTAVCDLGAFAPRTYTGSQAPSQEFLHTKEYDQNGRERVSDAAVRVGNKIFAAKIAGGKPFPERESKGASEWYRRKDGNGWRPVTAKSVEDAQNDPVTAKSAAYQLPYHYSKLKRAQNKESQRKAAKRDWLKKLYAQGLANEKDDFQRTRSLLVRRAVAADRPVQPQDEQYLFDFDSENWEQAAEDMLQWSAALDFEEYVDDWRTVATSEVAHSASAAQADGGDGHGTAH